MIPHIPQYILFTSENMIASSTDVFTNTLWHRCLPYHDDVIHLIELILKYESDKIQIVLKNNQIGTITQKMS